MWLTFLLISVACPFSALVFALSVRGTEVAKKFNITLLRTLLVGVFSASFFMLMPTHLATAEMSFIGVIRAFFLSVMNSVQALAFGCEFANVAECMTTCPGSLNVIYQTWISFIFVVAPVFTAGFILSMFKNISSYLRYLGSYFKDTYVFSELNEKSIELASDIKSKHKNASIVFFGILDDEKETNDELNERAKEIDAICFTKNILNVDFEKHSKNKTVSFFTIAVNESKNLDNALKLIEKYKNRENTNLYVFSIKIESELLLTEVDKGKIKVRRINDVKLCVYNILNDDGHALFENAREVIGGKKKISAVVVGLGNHGTEMVKALSWYCQMDGYELEINAFDKDDLAEERFCARAPELMSEKYNGVYVEGEAQYKINIHSNADVQTKAFADAIKNISDATYVFVALGTDDANINAAVDLRMYFERLHIHPVIQTVVYNVQQKKALEGIKNFKGQAYDIDFVGDIVSSYSEDVILVTELENAALVQHKEYCPEEDFWNFEYNYRSSIASALHEKARIDCRIPGAEKDPADRNDEENRINAIIEHCRWNAYMRAEGYIFSGSKEKPSRNDLGKMHHNLVDFSALSDEDKRKDLRTFTKK